ncbi:PREDICTED: 28S ribosomal protein S31, mitochondrial, partial [Galeopterus variegatus]|uniref:Small ribosomal subunit protein mS31 n=1 Tax=Galeopterus variegatus TaxID=482537 RepID=A0ABM0S2I0_GALVR
MFSRVSVFLPLRPLSRLPLSSGSSEVSAAAIVLPAAPHGTVRTKNIQRYFGTNSVVYSKKDEQSVPAGESSRETSESQDGVKENTKKDLLDIIKDMKVELSTVNVQTTKPPNRRPLKSLEATIGRLRRATEDTPMKRNEPLSPELVAAASAVADSLPFDKKTTKSIFSFSNIISDMKVARSAARVSARPMHQFQFDEGFDNSFDQEETANLRKSLRKNIFKGKRLNIFDIKAVTEEVPETETSPSLWDVEFAKQLATVSEQPFQNGFEEMIQWTKEGKLWEFPINNEA